MLKSQYENKKIRLEVQNNIELKEIIETEKQGKGRKFVSRFIEAGVAHYQEFGTILITKETLDKFIHTMVGCPLIINHKEITDKNVDKERVGVISDVWYNPDDGWYYCSGIIWDLQAIDLVKNQGWSVSCTYDFVSDNLEKTHNGQKINMTFIDGEFLHLALVNNPRYERANIVINSKDEETQKVDNGWITLDETDEEGNHKKIWIPENVHWVPPKERARVYEICKNYKQGDETKYDFSHTRDEEEYKKFQKEVDKQEDKELKETKNNKAQNGKDLTIMTVLKDLEKFIKGIVDNACDKEEKVENEDKRKIIDEVGGILKDKVDEEVWRTVIGKLEKIAYNPSETDKADNKCKNEDDEEKEEKEEKFEEEKEIAENKKAKNEDKEDKEEDKKEDKADNKCAKNSMEDIAGAIMGGNVKTKTVSSYVSQSDRLKAGENY